MKLRIRTNLKSFSVWLNKTLSKVPYIAALSYSFSYVLLMFRNNIFDIPLGEIFIPLVLTLLLVHVSYKLFQWIIKNNKSAGVMTFLWSIFMFQFEFIFVRTAGFLKTIIPIKSSYDVLLVFVLSVGTFGLLCVTGILIKKWPNLINGVRKFIDVTLGVYLLVTLVSIAFLITTNYRIFSFGHPKVKNLELSGQETPDIYYFVFDRYASERTLNKHYDFFNINFISQMQSLGFNFNNMTYSNYPYTATSLSSSLNYDYLDEYLSGLPDKYSESVYNEMIDESLAISALKNYGYEYHHIGSWWGATRTSDQADVSYVKPFEIEVVNFKFVVSDFQDQLLRNHIIRRVLAAEIPIISQIIHYEQPTQRNIVKYQLDSVGKVVEKSKDKDVVSFVHVLSPHPQYVFNRDGEVPEYHPDAGYGDVPEKIKYVNQLEYINKQILKTLDYILENSENPPIIIFQPDEGPYIYEEVDDSTLSRSERMKWKYGVTSAFYLPGYVGDEVSISPVNIFPFIFNNYFGQQLELQYNRQYWYDNDTPYNFQDISDLFTN